MKLRKASAIGILTLTMMVAVPAAAHAQHCLGLPIANQRGAASLNMETREGETRYGVSGRFRQDGPLSLGASYAITSIDGNDTKRNAVGFNAAYDLPLISAVATCAVAGAEYDSYSESEYVYYILTVPVGIALGKSFLVGNNVELVPYAMPHLLWTRYAETMGGNDETISSTDFGVNLGATLRLQRLLLNAGLHLDSGEGSKARFGFGVGLAF